MEGLLVTHIMCGRGNPGRDSVVESLGPERNGIQVIDCYLMLALAGVNEISLRIATVFVA